MDFDTFVPHSWYTSNFESASKKPSFIEAATFFRFDFCIDGENHSEIEIIKLLL